MKFVCSEVLCLITVYVVCWVCYRWDVFIAARDRTLSEASTSSGTNKPYKGPHAGLEKSLKDLQRQTVSLQRLKVVLNEQVDKAFKRISEVFKELHNQ